MSRPARYGAGGVDRGLFECVINVSEGRDQERISALAAAGGRWVLDVHSDPDHHRSVITLAGPAGELVEAARSVARATVALVDLGTHAGAHPRLGALDVVPWVALGGWPVRNGGGAGEAEARALRDDFARWAARELGLPCFLYGPERTLPALRRTAWSTLGPDTGPGRPHPTAGAAAVGVRPVLVAYNLWLADPDLGTGRRIAAELRGPGLRTLGLRVGAGVQVSCNLTDPWRVGPADVYDAVGARAPIARAELVGLLPRSVLEAAPRRRWGELGIGPSDTIEARLEQAGLDGGRFAAGTG
ncbi:MAG TPA: hypothetical protein VFN68_00360 [Acidimicrobiales bacterium]|nr:hypothetical protein [Acidimicrobiales bacterium]